MAVAVDALILDPLFKWVVAEQPGLLLGPRLGTRHGVRVAPISAVCSQWKQASSIALRARERTEGRHLMEKQACRQLPLICAATDALPAGLVEINQRFAGQMYQLGTAHNADRTMRTKFHRGASAVAAHRTALLGGRFLPAELATELQTISKTAPNLTGILSKLIRGVGHVERGKPARSTWHQNAAGQTQVMATHGVVYDVAARQRGAACRLPLRGDDF